MTLFKDKYRIESARLKGWDYSSAGWYFVTICTQGREAFFGDVVNGEVDLSPIGDIVAEEWRRTEPVRRNVGLDEWVVMPNHIHGIIVINNNPAEMFRGNVSDQPEEMTHRDETPHRSVSTGPRLTSGSLGAIIGQFKSVCTKRIWAAGYRVFDWQPRYFDHIVRDEEALNNIRRYIANNPAKWESDKNNPANLWM